MAGLSFMSDESYCSQNSKGDLWITEYKTNGNDVVLKWICHEDIANLGASTVLGV